MSSQVFCSEDRLETCLEMLSGELSILGFPKVVGSPENGRTLLAKLVNVFWSVLQNKKVKIRKLNEQNELILKLRSEIKNSFHKNKQLEGSSNCLSNDLDRARNELRKAVSERDSALREVKELKAEIGKLNNALITQRLQHENDLRRADSLLQNLQSQFLRIVETDQKFSQCPVESAVPSFSEKTPQELYLEKHICQLDNNIQTLLVENASVRCTLLKLFNELSELNEDSGGRKMCLAEHIFCLPYEDLLNKIETSVEEIAAKIKTQLLSSNN